MRRILSVLLALIGISLLINFMASLDFSRTYLSGFIWTGSVEKGYARQINESLIDANLCNLSSNSNPPRILIYYVEGLRSDIDRMRTTTYSVYDHGVWIEDIRYSDLPRISYGSIVYRVTPVVEFKKHVPVLKDTTFITVKGAYNSSSGTFLVESCGRPYIGFSDLSKFKPTEFANDGFSRIVMNHEELKEIRNLTLKIIENARSDYEKVVAIQRYLMENYRYDFNYEIKGDPVYWFLFKGKRGICKHFASAFVVMCNSVGIPARVVVGYQVKPTPGNQSVFADQAHMWAEVKFKEGWVEFDPTPPSSAKRIKTRTHVTFVDSKIMSGENFTVEGVVEHEKGPVENGFVEIYLKRNKDERGILIGTFYFENGHFKKTIRAPNVTGRYHVVAHFVGSMKYEESWSDPVVEIYEKPVFSVDIPDKTSTDFNVSGRLITMDRSVKDIYVFVDGEFYKKIKTDENGNFSVRISLERGFHEIKFVFKGSKFILPSHFEKRIEAGDIDVIIQDKKVIAGKKNRISMSVLFNKKPVEHVFINGIEYSSGENVALEIVPDRIGLIPIEIRAYGFKKVVTVKSVAATDIRYEYGNGFLRIYVVDSLGNPVNGSIYVDGMRYEVENGFLEIPVNGSVEIYYPGDEFHMPARVRASPSQLPAFIPLLLIPIPVLIGYVMYNRWVYGIDVRFEKEHPDLPLIWRVGERIRFSVSCRRNYVIRIDGRDVEFSGENEHSIVFDKKGRHVLEFVVKRGEKVKRCMTFHVDIVDNYGEAIVSVLNILESEMRKKGINPEFLTLREIIKAIGCNLKKTLSLFEDFRYGKRGNYSREDFICVFKEVMDCLRELRS